MVLPRILNARPQKESEVERVHRLIKGWILQCDIRPGDYISELQLARLCKSSRTPVREACNRLSQENWIQRLPRRGYQVPPISSRDIVEMYEFRILIEGFAAERAARLVRPEEIEELEKLIAPEGKAGVTVDDLLRINEAFHLAVARISKNQRVVDQLRLTLEYVHRLDILSLETDPVPVLHGEILSAIAAREPGKARKAMVAHVEVSRDRILRVFGT